MLGTFVVAAGFALVQGADGSNTASYVLNAWKTLQWSNVTVISKTRTSPVVAAEILKGSGGFQVQFAKSYQTTGIPQVSKKE